MSCECCECRHIAAARGVTIPSAALVYCARCGANPCACDEMAAIARSNEDLHAARNELTRARLVLDLMAQRLGVPNSDEREPYYEWLLEAVEDMRERCGEIEPQGDRHGG